VIGYGYDADVAPGGAHDRRQGEEVVETWVIMIAIVPVDGATWVVVPAPPTSRETVGVAPRDDVADRQEW
jgi:hypothetical protein